MQGSSFDKYLKLGSQFGGNWGLSDIVKKIQEEKFQIAYKEMATKMGLSLDPDDPKHFYDYRSLYKETGKLEPDEKGHFPSKYKLEGHPRMIIDEIDTKIGEPVKEEKPKTISFDKYKLKLTGKPQLGIGAKAIGGATLTEPTETQLGIDMSGFFKPESPLEKAKHKFVSEPKIPSYWGISDITKPMDWSKFKDPKMVELQKVNFQVLQQWFKELKESKDKWAFLKGEDYSPELIELKKEYTKLAPHMYEKSEQWIQATSLAAIATGLAYELIPLVTKAAPEMLRKILYKVGIEDVDKKELHTALYNVTKGTDTPKQREIYEAFIKAKEIGVPFAERLKGVKIPTITPRFAFGTKLYAGLPADEIVKSIVKAGKVTADMVKGLSPAKLTQVTRLLTNVAPALASEFSKIAMKVEVPKAKILAKEPEAEKFVGKAFRAETFIPEHATEMVAKMKTAKEKLDYDYGTTGNYTFKEAERVAESVGVDLSKVPKEDMMWVAPKLEIAEKYGLAKEIKIPKDTIVLAKDEEGGSLILKNSEKYIEEPKVEEPEVPPKEPWEPLTLPPPAEVPKLELEFKEPNVHKYYMPKDQLMREIGAEPLTRPIMLRKEAFMLKKPDVKKWLKDIKKEVQKKVPFAEKLKAGIFNLPTQEVARFRDLLNTYVEKLPESFDTKTKEIFLKLRSFTKGMLDDANEMRVRAGLKPITDFGAYVPHFLDELARKVRLDEKTRKVMEGIAGKKLPKGGNPTALQRKIGAELDHIFSKDLFKLLSSMAEYDLRDIYLAEPYAILRAQMKELEKEGLMPESVRSEVENFIAYDIFDKRVDLDKAINNTPIVKIPTDILNKVLKPFNRVITNPVKIASSLYRFGVFGGAIAGKVRMLPRNFLQFALNLCIYGPQATIKGQFVAPKDVVEKIRNLDVYKLSVRKFEDVPATIPWGFKTIAKGIQAGLAPYAKTHAGLTYISNVDRSARVGYFWSLGKQEWQKSEGAMKYTKGYAKKHGIKEGTQKYENLFHKEGDELFEAEEAIGSTQWFYFKTRMPRVYRGEAAKAFWSLNSWWMNYFGRHLREMMSRCRGVTGKGRILTHWERLNAFKGLAIILGIGEAVRRKYKLRIAEFLAFPFPRYIQTHLFQVMINAYGAITARNQKERDTYQSKFKYNLKMLVPYSGAYKEFVKFLNGEITLKEYLFYVEKVAREELIPPSPSFDKYGREEIPSGTSFDKYGGR